MSESKGKLLEWQYTQEQAELIKAGDIPARNKFFEDNYKLILFRCYHYSKNLFDKGIYSCLGEDLISLVYLDLSYYDFSNDDALSKSMFYFTFKKWRIGGWNAYCKNWQKHFIDEISLETVVCNEIGFTLEHFLTASNENFNIDDYLISVDSYMLLLDKYLTSQRRKEVFYLYLLGYRVIEITRKLNINDSLVRKFIRKVRYSILSDWDSFIVRLKEINSDLYDKLTSEYMQSVFNEVYSKEKKERESILAKNREYKRRARKREEAKRNEQHSDNREFNETA